MRTRLISAIFVLSLLPKSGYAMASCESYLTSAPRSQAGRVQWLIDGFAHGGPSFRAAEDLAKQIQQKSQRSQTLWVKAIAAAYPTVAKGRAGPPPPYAVIAGKRLLDRVLFRVQNLNGRFEKLSREIGTQSAFIGLLEEQTDLFHTKCSAADVLQIFNDLEGILKSWQMQNPSGAPTRLLVGGSFPNGKWRPGSDIDLSITNGSMAKALIAEAQAKIASGLPPDCQPKISVHVEPAVFYGRLNPFVIEISVKGRQIDVFAPTSSLDEFMLRSAPPQIYEWK